MTHRHGRRCILNLFILSVVFNTAAFAQTAVIGGSIYTGANDGSGPVLAPNALAPPIMDARVLVQNQHSGGAVITYGTVTGNTWTATVPAPGDYVVMFSAAGHDTTSREFTVAPGDTQSKDAYLPPLPVPSANLLVYSFYDNMVNGEDDAPDDPPLNGVTFMAWDDDGDLLATGISGSQPVITLSTGQVITNTAGLYYFTGLPPGEVLVTSDPGTAYLADNPGLGLDATTEYYLMSSEEGGPRFEAVLYPGDPGTEAGGYIVWHGYVKKLGAIDAGNVAERFPPGTTLANAATIMGTLVDADMAFDPIEPEDALVPAMHPGVTANVLVPDGFVVLFTDEETIPTHPVATAETGASGEFTFNNVPPGKYKLFLSDIPIDYVYVQVQVAVGPNQVAALSPFTTLLPRFYARVQGFVYDNATTPPTPMSGAKVNIRYKDGAIQHTTTTDANGWYNFDDMPEIEVLAYVDVEPPPGYRGAMITDTFYPDAHRPNPVCHPAVPGCVVLGDPLPVTHNGMNRYVQWFTANYRADLYVEPIPPPEVHIGGFVFNDELATGTWVGDGAYDRNDERTLHGVKVDLLDATGTTVLATTASGAFDKAATL
ncbi:MAG: collagen binding domain-containing protein, partial [Phycisphaerae bacterium]